MPAARYWRIVGAETYAGRGLELSELHLYGVAGRLDAAATLYSSIAPIAGTLAALQDDDLTTTCCFAGDAVRSGGFGFVWDFGPGVEVDAIGVRVGAGGAADTFLTACTLQYSFDGVFWVFVSDFNRYEFPGAFQYTKTPKPGDPYYANVSLLLHMDGANGSTTFIDNSPSPKTLTRSGSAQISTVQSKFGGASAYFSGGGGSYVYAAPSADFGFGAGDFTVEGWMRSTVRDTVFLDLRVGSAEAGVFIANHPNKGGGIAYYQPSTGVIGGNTPTDDGSWHHYAWTRVAGVLRMFSDGVKVYEGVLNSDFGNSRPCWLGVQFGGTTALFNGYLDDIRITKGIGRYIADFTPPPRAFPNASVDPDSTIFASPVLRTPAPEMAAIAAASSVPSHSAGRALVPQTACDTECGGAGVIYGTVEVFNQAGNLPLPRRVRLHRSRDGLLVRETWSNAQGQYRFEGISQRYTYDVIAWDHEGLQRSVVANDLTSEVMP